MTAPRSIPVLPLIAVAVTLVLWASAFVAIRYLGTDVSPGALSLGRLLVGSVALGIAVAIRRPPWPRSCSRNGPRAGWCPGSTLAFAGVALIAWASADPATGGHRDVLGVLLTLLCAVVYAISVIVQKPLLARLPALQLTWLACTVGALAGLPFAGQLIDAVTTVSATQLLWIGYLGLFPTAVAFTTYAYALTTMTATDLGVTTYLVPLITVALAWVFLREAPPLLAVLGGVVCLVGVWLARRQPRVVAAVRR